MKLHPDFSDTFCSGGRGLLPWYIYPTLTTYNPANSNLSTTRHWLGTYGAGVYVIGLEEVSKRVWGPEC
jgi:hypothetical protein